VHLQLSESRWFFGESVARGTLWNGERVFHPRLQLLLIGQRRHLFAPSAHPSCTSRFETISSKRAARRHYGNSTSRFRRPGQPRSLVNAPRDWHATGRTIVLKFAGLVSSQP
jgi:hypothetical protein